MSGGTAADTSKLSDEEYCAPLAEQQRKPSAADAIPGGRLLGCLGRKTQEAPPGDPRCANVKQQ